MSNKKKNKKVNKIIEELEYQIQRNENWCSLNGLEPTPYMEGINDVCKKLLKLSKKLKKK